MKTLTCDSNASSFLIYLEYNDNTVRITHNWVAIDRAVYMRPRNILVLVEGNHIHGFEWTEALYDELIEYYKRSAGNGLTACVVLELCGLMPTYSCELALLRRHDDESFPMISACTSNQKDFILAVHAGASIERIFHFTQTFPRLLAMPQIKYFFGPLECGRDHINAAKEEQVRTTPEVSLDIADKPENSRMLYKCAQLHRQKVARVTNLVEWRSRKLK